LRQPHLFYTNMSNQLIDNYILAHTSPENDVLNELNRQTHLKVLNPRMLSGHLQGKVLEMISCMIHPEKILEIGTYTGYSAICLAKGLKANGCVHTIELDDELGSIINEFVIKSGCGKKIILHIGDALEIVPVLNETFDLVFIDGDKRQYLNYYQVVFEKVKSGGFILADNVLWDSKVVQPLQSNDLQTKSILEFNQFVQQDERVENVIFPFRDGIMVIRKK